MDHYFVLLMNFAIVQTQSLYVRQDICRRQNHKQRLSYLTPLHRLSPTYAIVTSQKFRSKSNFAQIVCKHCLHIQSTIYIYIYIYNHNQGSSAEIQIQTHCNLISSNMIAPSPMLSPSSILQPPSPYSSFITKRKISVRVS